MKSTQARIQMIPHFPPIWAEVFGEDDCGIFAECSVKDLRFVWRWIYPGRFMMGSNNVNDHIFVTEQSQREVLLTRGFWLGETPVTQAQWQAVMGNNPSHFKGQQRPVEQVSWQDCLYFAAKLNALLPGLNAALPTEAQWENACRAGTQSDYHDGSLCTMPDGKDPAMEKLGWYAENSNGETHDVKLKAGNAWGLHDMHGNVWEWCQDSWDGGIRHVVKGGSWRSEAQLCSADRRNRVDTGYRGQDKGIRLAAGQESAETQKTERSGLP
jgi:formylglycine-generating enzyme